METDNVFLFPASSARTWAEIERALRTMIADPVAADYVCTRLHADFNAAWFELPATSADAAVVGAFHTTIGVLIERLAAAYLEIARGQHV